MCFVTDRKCSESQPDLGGLTKACSYKSLRALTSR